MLLNGFGGREPGIAEFHVGDLERGTFDADFLHVAVTVGIRDDGVLERYLQPVRREQLLHGIDGPGFRKGTVEEGKLFADGIVQLRIREPRKIVEVNGNSMRFFHVIGHQDARDLGLKVVIYFGEQPALNELVGRSFQIIPADLSARGQASNSDDLSLREKLFAVGVDFAQWRGGGVRSLRRSRESERRQEKEESAEKRWRIAQHVPIVAETG